MKRNSASVQSSVTGLGRLFGRTTRVVLVGGVAAGVGFAAVSGIAAAATGSSPAGVSAPAGPPHPPAGPTPAGGRGPAGHPGPMRGLGAMGGPGGEGTVTAIDGSTLTLRTLNGTETVDTSASTTFAKEMQAIHLSDVHLGDIVRVAGAPAVPGSRPSPPADPGTGTVRATQVTVVEPSLFGRVAAVHNGVYTLVGPSGQLLTVTTTPSTRYYTGAGTRASSTAITDGSRIDAQGTQQDLTHLSAAVISVVPTPAVPTPATPPGG